jgi:hypothetical protein
MLEVQVSTKNSRDLIVLSSRIHPHSQQLEDILALAEATEDMPGAFPGAGDEEWDDESEEEH